MSNDYVQKTPPSPSRDEREVDGYYASFYPGFVRRLAVRQAERETVIYEQEKPFVLPAGETEPWPCSVLHFSGGAAGRDIRLQVDDPHRQIARIEVVFKKAGDEQRSGVGEDGETLVLNETPLLCPPMCET